MVRSAEANLRIPISPEEAQALAPSLSHLLHDADTPALPQGEQIGAEAEKIPYRENRAVIFNADLFHESDTCVFRDDYESRRLNITFLYGRRTGNGTPLMKGNEPVAAGDDLGENH